MIRVVFDMRLPSGADSRARPMPAAAFGRRRLTSRVARALRSDTARIRARPGLDGRRRSAEREADHRPSRPVTVLLSSERFGV
jgi:hypothetical protein